MNILVVVRTLKKGGGISQWVLDYYNSLSQNRNISIDLVAEDGIEIDNDFNLDPAIKIISIADFKTNFLKYFIDWKKISHNSENEYAYIHIHTDNLVRFFYLLLLKKNSNVIIHSHNSFNDFVNRSFIKRHMNNLGKKIVKKNNFIRFACSDLAAEWLFDDQNYVQVNNGINLEKYIFDMTIRKKKLKELKIDGKIVYGHIGRFSYQKNHEQLIRIFEAVHDKNQDSILLLIGSGELESRIKQQVFDANLSDSVIFMGLRNDVNELLNVIDYLIFPSHYEGFPISLVEAQSNGIPVFFSDTITKNSKLLPQSFLFNLNDSVEEIADDILNKSLPINRIEANQVVKEKGYDKKVVEEWLYQYYKGEINK